ncbi:restriction endonuclease subunit S [Jeotgalibaca ciconiae]|uniref:Restriction endonuclease subunit S n=2 Tax=Jeotgalibaca ciconiae TaxID=2496265 RepID=A0A3Q9BMC2_9LACT|nr:restriction endonuclease subunit S [Jeotgalibaca ciconiae]
MVESFEYGLNSSATEYDGENKYIRITDIDDSSREFIQAGLTSPNTDLEKADNYLLKHGDILFARTGASVGKSYRYHEKDGKVYYAGFLIRARVKSEFDSEFIFQNTLTVSYDNFVRITSQRSGQPGINANEYACFEFFVPSKHEQSQIGKLFRQIDNTIALHQRKLETLKQLKKGFLQKLFPKNQENVPEIRFANFQAEWEQRKLDEISDKVTEKNINNEFTETLTNSAEYGIINQREFFDKDISNKKNLNGYYVVRKDDFVYNPRISNYAPVGPIKRNKLGRTGVMSPLYYIFRTHNIDKTFLEYYFDTTIWHRFMKLQGDSGARADRFAIKDSVFKTMPIPSPSIEEQEKIGCIFKVIDDTVALHQKKLEQLQLLKSGLLQKMFI